MDYTKLKKLIDRRIMLKYILLLALIIATMVMIIGGIFLSFIAFIGYIVIFIDMFFIWKYTSDGLFPNGFKSKDYLSLLELLSHSGEWGKWYFSEVLVVVVPGIDETLYANEKKEEYYRVNIARLQMLVHDKSRFVSDLVLFRQKSFGKICDELSEAYRSKEIAIKNYNDILGDVEKENNSYFLARKGISEIALKFLPVIVLGVYFLFKIIFSYDLKTFNMINEHSLYRLAYNTGADFLALVSTVFSLYLDKKNKKVKRDYMDELERLASLLDRGIITQEEFNVKKKQILEQ